MKSLMLAAAMAALVAPVVHAQSTTGGDAPFMEAPGKYLVFFPLNKAVLSAEDKALVAQAVEEFRATGSARIDVTGYTDTSGPADFNLRLSEERARSVAAELERRGVSAAEIVVVGRGEENLRIPTGDNVREPGNRRVEIVFDVPAPAPAPAVVAAAPEPVRAAEPEEEKSPFFGLKMAAIYGHNFGERDNSSGSGKSQNDLAGIEFSFNALPGDFLSVNLKQAVLYSFNGEDDGVNGRSGVSIGLTPLNLGIVNPYLSANAGYIYGSGVQNGFVAGPELGFNIKITEQTVLNTKVAYDYQFRNSDWDKGIVWGSVGLGFLF
ncbi:MAG: OmpA family protein [Geminicoccaceae bacterium]